MEQAAATSREHAQQLGELERRIARHDEEIQTIFEAIRQLMTPPEPPRKGIGFHIKEDGLRYGITRKPARLQRAKDDRTVPADSKRRKPSYPDGRVSFSCWRTT